jgi:Ca-activated chloride channel family protein
MKKLVVLFILAILLLACTEHQEQNKQTIKQTTSATKYDYGYAKDELEDVQAEEPTMEDTVNDWQLNNIAQIGVPVVWRGNSVISGKVTDSYNRPIADLLLRVNSSTNYNFSKNIRTNDKGFYKINKLPKGEFKIVINHFIAEPYRSEALKVNGKGGLTKDIQLVTYVDDPTIPNRFEGTLLSKSNEEDKVYSNVKFQIEGEYAGKKFDNQSDVEGNFVFEDIPRDLYTLTLKSDGFEGYSKIRFTVESDTITSLKIPVIECKSSLSIPVINLKSEKIDRLSVGSVLSVDDILALQPGFSTIRPRSGRTFSMESVAMDDNIGLAVGGAKDIDNFRENIKNKYMPQVTDLTYEGLFYDYYFDTASNQQAEQLFEPSYSTSTSRNPLDNQEEYYLSVGLNSNIKESDFARKNLNLTVVMDISGSMNSPFNRYHYDRSQRRTFDDDKEYANMSKMEIACKVLAKMTEHLRPEDRLAIVLYNRRSALAKPLNLVGKTDMGAIRQHILDLRASGGTNMYSGMQTATELYKDLLNVDKNKYENRIIFLTDAMPNSDVTDEHTIWGYLKANASQALYTIFIGVGVDFNTKLVEYITKTKGSNYYSVHSYSEFNKRLNEEFEYMVTPLVFDLSLEFDSDLYSIEQVIGSPEANKATGSLMYVNTLFPSKSEGGRTKGGIVLLKLRKNMRNITSNQIVLKCSYKNREGKSFMNEKVINTFSEGSGNPQGIRKAVLLSRYATMLQSWLRGDERVTIGYNTNNEKKDDWKYKANPPRFKKSKWERGSQKLSVEDYYREKFDQFKHYINAENEIIEDEDLEQEVELLDFLVNYNN